MIPFYTRFPELAARETRCIHILQSGGALPIGQYAFVELYCDEDGCDCRRVLLEVTTRQAPNTPLAIINYGWESVAFYTRWMHGDKQAGRDIANAVLDPLNPQSKYADHLLDMFRSDLMTKPDYVARLARHYEMFKQDLRQRPGATAAVEEIAGTETGACTGPTKKGEKPGPATTFEQFDDLMQQGYDLLESRRTDAACDAWLRAWEEFCGLYERGGFDSFEAFDERFRGTQYVYNWVQDLEMELHNAGLDKPVYFEHRIRFGEDCLKRFGEENDSLREHLRRAVAESWAELDQRDRSDALFDQWLTNDPHWGWGWVGWADVYYLGKKSHRDLVRAEQLLKRGFDVDGVRDRDAIIERLTTLIEDQGRTDEAAALKSKYPPAITTVERVGERSLSIKTKLDFGEDGLPLDQLGALASQLRQTPPQNRGKPAQPKIGRNDPCPCGSGKKYKKCCGKS